jgi:hypothetical protein
MSNECPYSIDKRNDGSIFISIPAFTEDGTPTTVQHGIDIAILYKLEKQIHEIILEHEQAIQVEEGDDDDYCLCDHDRYCETCGNLGVIICRCGGDLCVCENNGEYPCPDCG